MREKVYLDIDFKKNPDFIELPAHKITTDWGTMFPNMDLKYLDIERYSLGSLVQCDVKKAMKMDAHRHREFESVFMLSGRMRDEITGETIGPGESLEWGPGVYHEPNYLEPSMCLLLWMPALPFLNVKTYKPEEAVTQTAT